MQSKPLLAVSDSLGDEILLIVDRLKAGATLKVFVLALQLVSQSLFDSVKKRFIVGKQPLHHRSTGLVRSEDFDEIPLFRTTRTTEERKRNFSMFVRELFRSCGAIVV